jgi:hypothetical protein
MSNEWPRATLNARGMPLACRVRAKRRRGAGVANCRFRLFGGRGGCPPAGFV